MKSLISIDDLSVKQISEIYELANRIIGDEVAYKSELDGKILLNFFFENSTRTRLSFEMAAKKMGAKVTNIDISLSSLKKGESLEDMTRTISAFAPDFVTIRHNSSGIVGMLDKMVDASVINAGDGMNEHPTQALLDCFLIKEKKGDFANLKVAICGDVLHSRVARSNLKLLRKLGAKVNVVTCPTMIPFGFKKWLSGYDVELFESIEEGIAGCDVVMMLRVQHERMSGSYISSLGEYSMKYGLNHQRLKFAKGDAIVMHPGPINRNVEISSSLVDDPRCMALDQIRLGVYVRMAILLYLEK